MAPNSNSERKRYFWRKKQGISFFSKNRALFSFPGRQKTLCAASWLPWLSRERCSWGPAPRAAPGGVAPQAPCVSCSLATGPGSLWPCAAAGAWGLTVLSSFPVKADRAERACVDAALDILGTAIVARTTTAARLFCSKHSA